MRQMIVVVLIVLTLIPAIIIGVLLAPFGLADEFGDGYDGWISGICECPPEGELKNV